MPGLGQSNPNPLPVHGRLFFDARNYGLNAASADNAPAIQAAYDAAGAAAAALFDNSNVPIATVFIPAGTYTVAQPIYCDLSFVEIRGEGSATKIQMAGTHGYPVFVVGLPRTRGGTVPNASYRPDLFGKLDATAVSATGQRWGLRTNGDMWLTSPASHFSHGGYSRVYSNTNTDKWGETTQLTVEFAVEGFASGQIPGGTSLMGIGAAPMLPFQIVVGSPNNYTVYLNTQTAKFATPTQNFYTFSTGSATGVQKVAVQFDCVSQTVSAVVNGVQVAVSGPPIPAGSTLAENQWDTFTFNNSGSAPAGGQKDIGLYGLCFSKSIRYTTPGAGQAVARVDGGLISDRYRYFPSGSDDANCVGYLGFQESPAAAPRMLTVTGGNQGVPARSSAAFLINGSTYSGGATTEVRFKDLNVVADLGYGSAIAMAFVLEIHYDGVTAYGGAYGISSIPEGANYTIYLNDCTMRGYDSGFMAWGSTILAENLNFRSNGMACLRLVGCAIQAKDVYVPGAGNPQYYFAMLYSSDTGGNFLFQNITCDNEGDVFLGGGFYIERHGYAATYVRAENISFGTVGNVPFFRLRDMGPSAPSPTATLEANWVGGNFCGAFVEVDGPGWDGLIRNMSGNNSAHIANIGPSKGRVLVEDKQHVGPPHYGAWYKGGSKFLVTGAKDGQFREIGVAADGVIGSATPPQFIGRSPEQSTPNALALYAVDHTSIAATLSGQASSWGNLTNVAACSFASQAFSSTLNGTPTSWRFGLSTVNAQRQGGIAEPAPSTGYIVATVANDSGHFTAASAGSKASTTAISFGTATAPYTVNSLYIADQSGSIWATIQLANPLHVTVGMTPTIPAGALTFTHTPMPGTQFGCLTDYGWAKVWDYFFRGAAYTPPPQLYVALTTSATSKSTTTLSEPSGNGYARVAVGSRWFNYFTSQQPIIQQYGDVTNTSTLAFPNPTGPWGTITCGGLVDASSGGNVWAVAPLTSPVSPASGTGAPTFAAGALLVALG